MEKIDIILLTCNRQKLTMDTIWGLVKRTRTPFRLIVVDNGSSDDTIPMLQELQKTGTIAELILIDKDHPVNICQAYNLGFEKVESEYFICMQDDIIVPDLEPDWIQQLVNLMEKYPDHGGIGCRIQHIPNLHWTDGDLTPARKALSAYARIQRKSDIIAAGGFGDRQWDDLAFVAQIREKLGKKVSWANNIWCDHTGYMVDNRGYPEGWKRMWGMTFRPTAWKEKPYPKIDPKTNVPLPGERRYR